MNIKLVAETLVDEYENTLCEYNTDVNYSYLKIRAS